MTSSCSTFLKTSAGKTQGLRTEIIWSHVWQFKCQLSLELSTDTRSWNAFVWPLHVAWASSQQGRRRWVKLLIRYQRVPRPKSQLTRQKLYHLSWFNLRIHTASLSLHFNFTHASQNPTYIQEAILLHVSLENTIYHKHYQFFGDFFFSLALYLHILVVWTIHYIWNVRITYFSIKMMQHFLVAFWNSMLVKRYFRPA